MLGSANLVAFLPTTDADRARAFFRDLLGLRLVAEDAYALSFDANGVSLRVTLVDSLDPHPFTTLGWWVDDIAATADRLREAGVALMTYEALDQDDRGLWQPPGSRVQVGWFRDPDGNRLSITGFEKEQAIDPDLAPTEEIEVHLPGDDPATTELIAVKGPIAADDASLPVADDDATTDIDFVLEPATVFKPAAPASPAEPETVREEDDAPTVPMHEAETVELRVEHDKTMQTQLPGSPTEAVDVSQLGVTAQIPAPGDSPPTIPVPLPSPARPKDGLTEELPVGALKGES